MCLSSPFVFIYIRLFPLKSNTPFTQIACFSAGLRHAASVAKAADSGWSARVPGGRAPSRQRCATADSGSASDDRRRGAAIPGGGEAGALACDGEAEGQRASVRREGWQCVWMRTPTTLTHTHAHRRTHTHARPRTLTHPRIHHTRPHRTLTPTHTFTRSHTHTHTPPTHTPHALTYTLTHSHSHTRAHHAHTHTRTLTHTPTHTHPCAAMIRLTSTATKRAGGTVTLAGSSETRGAVARGGSECGFGVCRPAVYQMRD